MHNLQTSLTVRLMLLVLCAFAAPIIHHSNSLINELRQPIVPDNSRSMSQFDNRLDNNNEENHIEYISVNNFEKMENSHNPLEPFTPYTSTFEKNREYYQKRHKYTDDREPVKSEWRKPYNDDSIDDSFKDSDDQKDNRQLYIHGYFPPTRRGEYQVEYFD